MTPAHLPTARPLHSLAPLRPGCNPSLTLHRVQGFGSGQALVPVPAWFHHWRRLARPRLGPYGFPLGTGWKATLILSRRSKMSKMPCPMTPPRTKSGGGSHAAGHGSPARYFRS